MKISELTKRQVDELNRLLPLYGHSGYLSTEGNEYLLSRVLDKEKEDIDILEAMKSEFNFYRNVTPLLLGEMMMIILKDDTTEPIL